MQGVWAEQQQGPVQANRVNFYRRPVENPDKTLEAGRPVHDLVEYVRVDVPGDRTLAVDRRVREDDKHQYPRQYQAFLADRDQETSSGTLLSATGLVDAARVEDLAFFRVRTVEQYAAVTDGNLQALGPGSLSERQKCRDYLELAKGNAPFLKLQAQLEALANENSTLKHQLTQMGAMLDKLNDKAPEKPTAKGAR